MVEAVIGNKIDLLNSFVPAVLISELTSKCNLRCIYCPKGDTHMDAWNSTPGRDEQMDGVALERYMDMISEYRFDLIHLNGIGEFTFRPDWIQLTQRISANAGSGIAINTNFSKIYDHVELDCLLGFRRITVSIDTVDADLLRKVRKKVDFNIITTNLINLRKRSDLTGRKLPFTIINATIYLENLKDIFEMACYAEATRVDALQVSRMTLDANSEFPRMVTRARPDEAREALRQLDAAKRFLSGFGISFIEFGDLRTVLTTIANSEKPDA
jgi:MoaA/NifB/PqqE/SkfB family radical SAM enzyme